MILLSRYFPACTLLISGVLFCLVFFLSKDNLPSQEQTRKVVAKVDSDNEIDNGLTEISHTSLDVRFLDSKHCALCHSNSDFASAMRDRKDRPVSPYDLWQTSMMANSSRDPFWRAVLSAEVVATPSKKALIEEKCTRCHTPMAAPVPESPKGEVLAFLNNDDERSKLGMDGVSCTVCHQITDKNLGNEASFTGHFEINQEQKIFGPHREPFTMPMRRHVGYTPTHSNHILKSGLCATCHTVNTTSRDEKGNVTSDHEFHEQSPYLEWRNSVFNDEVAKPSRDAKSCQACHMPVTDVDGRTIATRIAHNPGGRDFPFLEARKPFGRHAFLGGNTLMKRILRDNADELGVIASANAMNQSIKQTVDFLGTETAKIKIDPIKVDGEHLSIPITVQNLSGHKLPTAYPSRRVWIEVQVTNADKKVVFTSGRHNENGELVDSTGKVLPSELAKGPINKHYSVVSDPDQVQVYETIMADASGNPTFTLLRGATYKKDNRLLPRGWSSDHADGPATQPYGIGDDPDFVGGSDTVVYKVKRPSAGRYSVQAKLLFQVISPRHANELFEFETPQVKSFKSMFDKADRKPETLASKTATVVVNND